MHEQHRAALGVPPHNKNDIIYLTFQLQNYYHILPKQNEIMMMMMMMMMMMDCFMIWLTDDKHLALFPAGTIFRGPQYRESPTHREQGLDLRRA